MSPLPGDPIWHVSSRSGEASRELLYSVYFTNFTLKQHLTFEFASLLRLAVNAEERTVGSV